MAHKASQGSTALGRDSKSKRLGIKIFAGSKVSPGNIIVRQRGTKYHPGRGVKIGKDHTIFALKEGVVFFSKRKRRRFDGRLKKTTFINVK